MFTTYDLDKEENEDTTTETPIYLFFNSTVAIKVSNVAELKILNRHIEDVVDEIEKDIALTKRMKK